MPLHTWLINSFLLIDTRSFLNKSAAFIFVRFNWFIFKNRSSKVVRATRSPWFTRSAYLGKIVRSGRSVVRVVHPDSFGCLDPFAWFVRSARPGCNWLNPSTRSRLGFEASTLGPFPGFGGGPGSVVGGATLRPSNRHPVRLSVVILRP